MTLCITVSQWTDQQTLQNVNVESGVLKYLFVFYFILFFRLPTSQQHSPSLCCWCWSSEEWHFLEPSMVSSITFTLIHLGLLTLRYCLTHVPNAIQLFFSSSWGMYLVQHFVSFFVGVDGCRNPNILFICPMFRLPDDSGELQQIQQQLLQASPKRLDRDDTRLTINSVF